MVLSVLLPLLQFQFLPHKIWNQAFSNVDQLQLFKLREVKKLPKFNLERPFNMSHMVGGDGRYIFF